MYADQVTLTLLPQEQEGQCKFAGQFVATRNALEKFGWEVIVAALKSDADSYRPRPRAGGPEGRHGLPSNSGDQRRAALDH